MLEFKWPNIDEVDMHNSIKKYYLSYIEFKQAITGIFHPKTSFLRCENIKISFNVTHV